MRDITMKYPWNDRKDRLKEELSEKYNTLSKNDKKKVYEFLNEKRKETMGDMQTHQIW